MKILKSCFGLALLLGVAACGNKSERVVYEAVPPEDLSSEEGVVYLENERLKSPISVEDFLSLAEVHDIEDFLGNYNNIERAKENPELASYFMATKRDSAVMRLANRFMRMSNLAEANGKADDKLRWAQAVRVALDEFCQNEVGVSADSALQDVEHMMCKFSNDSQMEMNLLSYVLATISYFHVINAYNQWLDAAPKALMPLLREEYQAWHDFNMARYKFWSEVSYTQAWYSMKPLETNGYYAELATERCEDLKLERSIIENKKSYLQKGKTVTTKMWEQWIEDHSVPKDIDDLKEMEHEELIPSESHVAECVSTLKSTCSRWLKARQAIAAALPSAQAKAYDNLTADIHFRIIDNKPIDPDLLYESEE